MNVKIIFLHDQLEEEIYLKQLKGYIQEGQENKVYLLSVGPKAHHSSFDNDQLM